MAWIITGRAWAQLLSCLGLIGPPQIATPLHAVIWGPAMRKSVHVVRKWKPFTGVGKKTDLWFTSTFDSPSLEADLSRLSSSSKSSSLFAPVVKEMLENWPDRHGKMIIFLSRFFLTFSSLILPPLKRFYSRVPTSNIAADQLCSTLWDSGLCVR